MHTVVRSAWTLIAALLAMALSAPVAVACSCVERSTAEHVAEADLVARVIVEHVNMPVAESLEGQLAIYTMRPTYVWKGDVVSQFKVGSEPSGAGCGLEGIAEGRDVVLFANDTGEGWSANLCGGTAPASEALVAELLEVAGPGVAPDSDPGAKPGEWVWPTVAAAAAVLMLVAVVARWWVRLRKPV